MNPLTFSLLMTGVLLNAAAQLLLKAGTNRVGEFSFALDNIVPIGWKLATEPHIVGGLGCYVISVVVWIMALSRVEVSIAYPLLSVGYVLALSGRPDWPEASKVAASGFRDMSRLAAGDPVLATGISRTNRDHLLEQLDGISHALTRLRRHLEADDPRLVELFEEARAVRDRWLKDAQ